MKAFFAALVLFGLLMTGCRKGEDDPALSLRSRKGRLSGDWSMVSGRASLTLYNYAEMYTFTGSRVTIHATPIYEPVIYEGIYSLRLKVKKNGEFKVVESKSGGSFEGEGEWNFTKGVGEEKNKEGVVFSVNKVNSGQVFGNIFSQWNSTFSYHIKELRNKRMVLSAGGVVAQFSDGRELKYTVEYTFEQNGD